MSTTFSFRLALVSLLYIVPLARCSISSYARSVLPHSAGSIDAVLEMEPIEQLGLDSSSAAATDQQKRKQGSRQLQSGLTSEIYVTQVNKTHVFPEFTLDPDCASGHDMNVAVTTLNVEGIYKNGTAVFSNTLRWLFYDLELDDGGMITSPRIVYDVNSQRFIVAATVTDKKTFSNLLVAVSKSGAPLSGTSDDWMHVRIDTWADPAGNANGNELWVDEIGLAVDNSRVYITGTVWETSSVHDPDNFIHSRLWTLDKANLYNVGMPTATNAILAFQGPIWKEEKILEKNSAGMMTEYLGPYYPATIEIGSTKESAEFGTYLVAYDTELTGDESILHVIRVNFPASGGIQLAEYNKNLGEIDELMSPLPAVEQPGTIKQTLSGFNYTDYWGIETGNRKVQDVAWSDGVLYVALTVIDTATQTAVYVAMIEAGSASTIADLGPFTSSTMDAEGISTDASAFYPAVAVNSAGNAVVGFGASGHLNFAGMYAFQIPDNSGVTPVAHLIKDGEADTESIDGITYFGATSGISVDPEDDDCFWAFNQFARETQAPFAPLVLHQWERGALATSWAKVCIST